jgi:hypothetical protein
LDKRGEKDKMKKREFIIGIFVLAVMALVVGAAGAMQIGGEADKVKAIIMLNDSMSFDDAKEEIDFILRISKSTPRDLEIIHGIAVEVSRFVARVIARFPAIDKVLPDRKVTLPPLPKPIAFEIK